MDEDRLIPWARAMREYLGISLRTSYNRLETDPEFRKLRVWIAPNRFGVRLSALQKFIATRPGADEVKGRT